ncbi:HEAT repeat domain-containing protein [Stigmatella aurantiaca]|uniref:WD domain G-beta repeat/PBS lyase HEAT-like repeat protein n=3 Tax=Stigmatella aurantiaca TaxID=41 RepID=E3FKJ3_STIAD|nr:HEAT repeat domain-containing protein [Stigmatella aurantiaca]ADO67966.1 WD domain G-beta repeat/PBS lyase HEAT-like repeat protein [Stigmatella aurantiaca DW4/3-1]
MANLAIGNIEKVRALAANSRVLLVGGARATSASRLTAYDFAANKVLWSVELPSAVLALALAGERWVAAGADGTVRVGALGDGSQELELAGAHPGGCTALALGLNGQRLYSVGMDGALRAWALASGSKLQEWQASAQPLRAVAVAPNNATVACAGDDAVVRSFTLASRAQRDMPGHDGPVRALAFTPRDGRLVSAGDDGRIRIWYLAGAVEFETRGDKDSGHAGPVLALLFPPTPAAEPGQEAKDRFWTAGADGQVKVWRLDERRKPRSFDGGSKPLHALVFAPPANPRQAKTVLGHVFTGGDLRKMLRITVAPDGTPTDERLGYAHGIDALNDALDEGRPRREAAVREAAALEEPEALSFVLQVLSSDRDAAVRALAASELAAKGRTGARPKLRERLEDDFPAVRAAALEALATLEESPLAAPRAALDSRHADIRAAGLRRLAALAGSSPLVPGLIAGKLSDPDPSVGLAALDALTQASPAGSNEPLKTAFERGPAPLKTEVLLRAAWAGQLGSATLQPLVARALDDADADVRHIAFLLRVMERRALAHALEKLDPDFVRSGLDVGRRLAPLSRTPSAQPLSDKPVSNAEAQAARAQLPGMGQAGAELTEADLEPLLAAMACRTPDTAALGALALAYLGDTRALGALLQLSREPDAAIRRFAAFALQVLKDPRGRERLVWMLDDEQADVRAAAFEAVVALDAETPLSSTEAALRSSFEDVRVRGLARLVELGTPAHRAGGTETLLGNALEDESSKVRGEAFRTLWAWNEKAPEKALDRALAGRFPDLRLRAVEVLAERSQEAWALDRLKETVKDRDAGVATAAYEAWVKRVGKQQPEPYLAALGTAHASLRALAAKGAAEAPVGPLRSPLLKLIQDEAPAVHTQALETLDTLVRDENGPLLAGLLSATLPLQVRAAELLATRGAEDIIEPMRSLITDKELERRYPPQILFPLRARAASALATLGSRRLLSFYTSLLQHEQNEVKEQGARGLATASRRGDEGALLDALGHAMVAVRSWAADGLARLGDVRALPVLTGTLRHEHLPVRLGALLSFAALGASGEGGMLHGLEDSHRDVQERVFAIILARDLRASRRGEPPDLLTSALSSARAEVRYAAARALELRAEPEAFLAHLVEVLMPPRPEKAGDMKEWPAEEERTRRMVKLAEALASDVSEQRYAAAQVLNLRHKPVEYFREAQKVALLHSLDAPWKPETTPRPGPDTDKPAKRWLRRLFSTGTPNGKEAAAPSAEALASAERQHLRRLAFGAYVGLLRQVSTEGDEGHRVRRDSVDRVVKLTQEGFAGQPAAVAALLRALEDPHQLVRKAALAGLQELYPAGSDEPLALALASLSQDVARAALDTLATRGDAARPRITAALNSPLPEVRRYAFELLEKLSPKGSLEPLLAALSSEHADLRVGVIERLAGANDARVIEALGRAMASEHEDLRMRAAELLAWRKDDRTVEVLSAFLRSENAPTAARALEALTRLASPAAVAALASRLRAAPGPDERTALVKALGRTLLPEAVEVLAQQVLEDEAPSVRLACITAAMGVADRNVKPTPQGLRDLKLRDMALAVRFLRAAARSQDVAVRQAVPRELALGAGVGQDALLLSLFPDRDVTVRREAVAHYSWRVVHEGAKVEPIEEVLRAGARELMLPAAEAVASKGLPSALRPLLLYARAGEPGDRERALLALGTLGDARALAELEAVAAGGTPEAPAEPSMVVAAVEGLGRLAAKLPEGEDRKRLEEKVEAAALEAGSLEQQQAGVRGLRFIGGERVRVKLEALLTDDTTASPVRFTAATELGKLGAPEAEPPLARVLDTHDAPLRQEARKALDALFPKDRVRVEFLAVMSRHPDISQPAATYLADEAEPARLVPHLATLKDEALRQRIRRGIARRGGLPVPELAALLAHEEPRAREEAAQVIGTWTGEPRTPLSSAQASTLHGALAAAERRTATEWAAAPGTKRPPFASAWQRLLWAGARLGTAPLATGAHAILQGGEAGAPATVRQEAARTLGTLGTAEAGATPALATAKERTSAAEALRAALTDTDARVRSAAAAALARLAPERTDWALAVKPFDPVAVGPLASGLRAPEPLATSEGRRAALPALLASHQWEPLRPLATGGNPPAVKQDALAALGRMGDEGAANLLQGLAFDKGQPEALRKAAWRAHQRARRALARNRKEGTAS